MRYRLSELIALVRTPAGRIQIADGLRYRSWPLLSRFARLHRATLARKTKVVAVVGSFGKSTTTSAVSAALGLSLHPQFSFNCWAGVAMAVLRIRPSQPFAVIEVGISDVGQMAQYCRVVRPDVAIVTSIGSEHNRSLPSLEVTRHEKAEMVRCLPPTGAAILNGDDSNVLWMKSQTSARTITYGLGESNDIRASGIRLEWPHGTRFTLHADGETREVLVRLFGQHMVYSVLAAVAAARVAGIELDRALQLIESLPPIPGRVQAVALPNGAWILSDEYKSQVETVHSALDVFGQIPGRRIIALGELTEAPGKQGPIYRDIGARVAKLAAQVTVVGTHTSYINYASGASRAGMPRSAMVEAGHSAQRAAEILQKELKPGDVLLIKGRFNQHLERIALRLMGRTVRCDIESCRLKKNCGECPMLERGWGDLNPVT